MVRTIARMAIILSGLYSGLALCQALYPSSLISSLKDSDKDGVIDARDSCANTPLGSKVDNQGCPITELEYHNFDFDVQFDTARYQLSSDFYPQLQSLASFLKQTPKTRVLIEGHTDNTGQARFNLMLSKKRADAIAEKLVTNFDIETDRLKTFGYGQERPIASNDTEQGRMRNRRVSGEVVVPFRQPQNTNSALTKDANQKQPFVDLHELTIPFSRNQYRVKTNYRPSIQSIGQILRDNPNTLVIIEGYTDNSGSRDYNLALSIERANKVADIIQSEYAISADRFKVIGYGQDFPIASNLTLEGRIKNRRVNTSIVQTFKTSQEVILPKWTIWSVDRLEK